MFTIPKIWSQKYIKYNKSTGTAKKKKKKRAFLRRDVDIAVSNETVEMQCAVCPKVWENIIFFHKLFYMHSNTL